MSGATKPTILLVDDSTIDIHVLLDMLKDESFSINVALNGKDGLQKAELRLPDLILLDVAMPVMNGFQTCRWLKAQVRTRHIPIIFLTAATELERRLDGLSLGAVDYICKPFHAEEVVARVKIHLQIALSMKETAGAADHAQKPETAVASRSVSLARAATHILRQRLNNPPSRRELAQMIGTNEKTLNDAFQTEFSLPIYSWLREERRRMARTLLIDTESSIFSISEHLGYSSQANFAKAFRHRF
eukprot:gene19966-20483_t